MPPGSREFTEAFHKAASVVSPVVEKLKGDSMSDYLKPTTAMTVADINRQNEKYWGGADGNIGPAASEASAPMLAGTKVVGDSDAEREYRDAADPYEKAATQINNKLISKAPKEKRPELKWIATGGKSGVKPKDEVSPTPSDPPDERGNNLLGAQTLAGDAESMAEKMAATQRGKTTIGTRHEASTPKQRKLAVKQFNMRAKEANKRERSRDELVEGSEAMEVREHGMGQ